MSRSGASPAPDVAERSGFARTLPLGALLRARRRAVLVPTLCAVLAQALSVPAAAQDVEEILTYEVRVDVRDGGLMNVTESITVRALGREIRRGIYRDFPTSFPRSSGLGRIEAPFTVRSVRRDGVPEHYELLGTGGPFGRGGVRVRIGSPAVLLERGVHTYVLEYETERWVVFGDQEDRLYWNVTGSGWSFPIRSASARVRVAGLGGPPRSEAWTGPEGSTASDVEHAWDAASGEAVFRTTRALGPREGLTVEVRFPSGLLEPPSQERREAWFRLDWAGYVEAGYLVLLVIAVYLLMWRRVGMDPAAGPTRLRDEPPEGFSPAALGYLSARGYGSSQLTAALISMAMKGALRIERDGATWRLHEVDGGAALSAEERAVFDALLGDRTELVIDQANHGALRKAVTGLKRTLSRRLEREYFVNNRRWFVAGLAVSLIGFGALAWRWRFEIEISAWFLGVWLTIWTAAVASLCVRVGKLLGRARRSGAAADWTGAAVLGLFSLPFLAAEIFAFVLLLGAVPTHLVLAAVAVGAVNVLFYHLLERPTLRGRGVLDALDGFRSFLAGAEPDRRLVPSRPPELFERFLPYAIALGVETSWAAGCGDALAPGLTGAGSRVHPWYAHHDHGRHLHTTAFASSLGSDLASSLSAASSPPSSGGSGGGGGSSGGGGGGGGGGGW